MRGGAGALNLRGRPPPSAPSRPPAGPPHPLARPLTPPHPPPVSPRVGKGDPPIVSFVTHADVGAFDEADGQTGLAHLLEHMAFKGTPSIGTTDAAAEARLLDAADAAFYDLRDLKAAGAPARALAAAEAHLAAATAQADALAVPNAFGAALTRAGGVGLNASTSHDATRYYCSLPSNKLELWFALEAARFREPVFRELYTEKAVVAEERRARVDGAPLGKFQQAFARSAFANNYGRPVIGYAADVEAVGRRELVSFFQSHYGPRALTIAVVGDARPDRVRALAEKYFGGWAAPEARDPAPGSSAPPARPAAPPPRLVSAERAGPLVMQAYYRPPDTHPDAIAIEAAWWGRWEGVARGCGRAPRAARWHHPRAPSRPSLAPSLPPTPRPPLPAFTNHPASFWLALGRHASTSNWSCPAPPCPPARWPHSPATSDRARHCCTPCPGRASTWRRSTPPCPGKPWPWRPTRWPPAN